MFSCLIFFFFFFAPTDFSHLVFWCLLHTGVCRLWLTSQSRMLWRSTWWRRSNANITARDATVVFFCLSVSLSASSLPSFLCFFMSLPPCLFQCCTLVYLWKNKKGEMLSFFFFFFFLSGCFHASHLPWSHSLTLCLSWPLSLSRSPPPPSLPCYEYDSITTVNDNLKGHSNNNPWCSHSWYVLSRFVTSDSGPALPLWWGHRLCSRWWRLGSGVIMFIKLYSCIYLFFSYDTPPPPTQPKPKYICIELKLSMYIKWLFFWAI